MLRPQERAIEHVNRFHLLYLHFEEKLTLHLTLLQTASHLRLRTLDAHVTCNSPVRLMSLNVIRKVE